MNPKGKRLEVNIDRESSAPLHAQIASTYRHAIAERILLPGEPVETELALSKRLGVSRPTVRRALVDLANEGLISRSRSQGTIVSFPRVSRRVNVSSLYSDLEKSGQEPQTKVLEYSLVTPPPAIAEALRMDSDEEVFLIKRLRLAQNRPITILTNYLPVDVAPPYSSLSQGSLYRAMAELGFVVARVSQRVSAVSASAEAASLLDEAEGNPLLHSIFTGYDNSGRPIEYATHLYSGARYSINFEFASKVAQVEALGS